MFVEKILAIAILYIRMYLLTNKGLSIVTDNTTENCITPNNYQGECVLLTECPHHQHKLRYMDDDRLKSEYLQNHECDTESDDLKFCCPLNITVVADYSTEKCTTANNDQGVCVSLTECPHLQDELNYMEDYDSPNEKDEYLQSYECDTGSGDRKFCCPSMPIVVTDNITENCTTPNNYQGECVLLTECPHHQYKLRYMDDDGLKVEYLQSHECDTDSDDLKFCCPINPTAYEFVDKLPDVCGQHISHRIAGGEMADLGEFPWMALLNYTTRTTKVFGCGGILINSRYVLTAAHCVKGKDIPPGWKIGSVRLGEYNTSSEIDCALVPGGTLCSPAPLDVPVEEEIVHEDYDPHNINQYHDIALLRLAKSVPTTEYVSPICLPKDDLLERSFVADNAYVAGWGATEKSNRGSDVLLKVEIEIKPNSDCESLYKRRRIFVQDGQLCAGGNTGKDSCRGDSGGPLMQSLKNGKRKDFFALGLVSIGPSPCGRSKWPAVYTRITKYMPWIISKLKA